MSNLQEGEPYVQGDFGFVELGTSMVLTRQEWDEAQIEAREHNRKLGGLGWRIGKPIGLALSSVAVLLTGSHILSAFQSSDNGVGLGGDSDLGKMLSSLGPKTAFADENEPIHIPPNTGWTASAGMDFPGEGALFYAPGGLNICGVDYREPTLFAVVANEIKMNLRGYGFAEVNADPIDVGGEDYPNRTARLIKALHDKADELLSQGRTVARQVGVILIRERDEAVACKEIGDSGPVKTAVFVPSSGPAVVEQQVVTTTESCPAPAFPVPTRHTVPIAYVDGNTPQNTWLRFAYAAHRADWGEVGPWAPNAWANIDPFAAHLKTRGMTGEFVVVGDRGGRVALAFNQTLQHQDETKRKPDGSINPAFKNIYVIDGLVPGSTVIPFDPDTGQQLVWEDGVTPIVWAAGPLGTWSGQLPGGEVRVAVCINVPGQITGMQNPEVTVRRGANDQPSLFGENLFPATEGPVIKHFVQDQ